MAGSASAQFTLVDYNVPAPTCSITADDNVLCDFSSIQPLTGNLAYSITGFGDCTGTATRDTEMSLSAATAVAVGGATSVTIDLNTAFDMADGASEAFEFCLLTSLKDGSDREMFYQGQKISATFTADGGFTVSGITSTQFDGVSGVVDTNQKTFTISAYQCDETRAAASTALSLGTTLFICIDSDDDAATILSVDTFSGFKSTLASTDLLSGNTEVQGAGSAAVTIGTRPFASFFADANPMTIEGTVTLQISNNRVRRYLRILQSENEREFEVQIAMESAAQPDSSAPAYASALALLGSTLAAAMI